MADELFERRLAAIVAADVVGYSRLMGVDETGTLTRLKALRQTLIEPLITRYNGRIVKLMGDGVLIEFPSVVDALACSVQIQREIPSHNATLPEEQHIVFRIGINLGDIIVEEDDLYGDGVNIAARLEPLAESGGICLSQAARDALGGKLPLDYEDMGEQTLKNIAEPVRAWRVKLPADAVMPEGSSAGQESKSDGNRPSVLSRRWAAAAVMMLLLAAGGVWFGLQPDVARADPDKMAYPLPDKPSIAVLPFKNDSDDTEQDYFADGITDDIITTISRIPELFVIAHSSTLPYRDKPVKQAAEGLGVHYVLQGSVRKVGDQVRINAKLIDALDGRYIWTERYDRNITDIFALQDEIALGIADALHDILNRGEGVRVRERTTDSLEAWDLYIRGVAIRRTFNRETVRSAKNLWQQAVKIDPDYATAWAGLAALHLGEMRTGWSEDPKRSYQLATEYIKKALSLDENLPRGLYLQAFLELYARRHDEALAMARQAVASAPNNADAHYALADIMRYSGFYEEALEEINQAMRRNPSYPDYYLYSKGVIYNGLQQYDKAIEALTALLARNPSYSWANGSLAMSYVYLGRLEEAREAVKKELTLNPNATLSEIRRRTPVKHPAQLDAFADAVAKVGFPE